MLIWNVPFSVKRNGSLKASLCGMTPASAQHANRTEMSVRASILTMRYLSRLGRAHAGCRLVFMSLIVS